MSYALELTVNGVAHSLAVNGGRTLLTVLRDDLVYGNMCDIGDCPRAIVDRLIHYFVTYKRSPESENPPASIAEVYNRSEAHETVRLASADYADVYG